jgi:Domain of unknown function (DUF1841)
MFESSSRADLRRMYLEAWRKLSARLPLAPLEAQIAAVIEAHPEYIPLMDSGNAALAADFQPESGRENPFLHMGMHLAIREQVGTNRPPGIADIHARLARELGSEHAAEHAMMEALGETLWEAQRAGVAPDERAYVERLMDTKTPRRGG